jgi:hypothetical protein
VYNSMTAQPFSHDPGPTMPGGRITLQRGGTMKTLPEAVEAYCEITGADPDHVYNALSDGVGPLANQAGRIMARVNALRRVDWRIANTEN